MFMCDKEIPASWVNASYSVHSDKTPRWLKPAKKPSKISLCLDDTYTTLLKLSPLCNFLKMLCLRLLFVLFKTQQSFSSKVSSLCVNHVGVINYRKLSVASWNIVTLLKAFISHQYDLPFIHNEHRYNMLNTPKIPTYTSQRDWVLFKIHSSYLEASHGSNIKHMWQLFTLSGHWPLRSPCKKVLRKRSLITES